MPRLTVLSLGAGVQSSTLALLAAHGEVTPMPDAAIFADTRSEPASVYRWLDWLEPRLPFPVYRVCQGEGLQAALEAAIAGQRFAGPPFYTESSHGGGVLRRQCTREFKVQPITRKIRELLGVLPGQRVKGQPVEQWIGISLDEVYRMKPVRERWVRTRWPLIEKRMTRSDCLIWMQDHGYPRPPRSACVWCPYHTNREWRHLLDAEPEGWQRAIEMDTMIRGGVRGTKERLYLHRSLKPLSEVDLATEQERGQLELWDSECSGICNT